MPATPTPNRILVACAMKSGSTFVAKALALYFDAERVEPVPYWGRLEQSLHEHLIQPYLDRDIVLQLHLKPHVSNVEIIRKYGLAVVKVWRNLGDVIVSFDDHVINEDYRNPVCYIHDPARYRKLEPQRRYEYLIHHAIPWYIGFWLSWRQMRKTLPVVETRYEKLAVDPAGYFDDVIRGLGKHLDQSRLAEILARPLPSTRFNKGVNGRSVELLSDANKELLENLLHSHIEDLQPLIDELPWRPGAPVHRRVVNWLTGS